MKSLYVNMLQVAQQNLAAHINNLKDDKIVPPEINSAYLSIQAILEDVNQTQQIVAHINKQEEKINKQEEKIKQLITTETVEEAKEE